MLFMPFISQIRFSPDELGPMRENALIQYYDEADINGLDEVIKKAEAISVDESLACRKLIEKCPKLKWIQLQSVGYSKADLHAIRDKGIVLTTARGVCSTPVSEHVIMQMLILCRHFAQHHTNQNAGLWIRNYREDFLNVWELWGKTIGILGTGDIGTAVAGKAKAFNMSTIGYNHTGSEVQGFDFVTGPDKLDILLKNSDFIVLALPLTNDTYHIIGQREFEVMKPTAVVVNVARGSVVDEKALVAVLKDGRIAGAALDVFEEEPLSPKSSLWKMENVIITPHCAGWGENFKKRYLEIVCANLKCFISGDYSEMTGLVDQSGLM